MLRISFTTLATLACLALVALLGATLEGMRGNGVLLGGLAGIGITTLGIAYQRQVLERRPELTFGVLGLFLLVKLGVLLALAIACAKWEPVASRADAMATLLTFAVTAFAVLMVGTFENARALKLASSRTNATPESGGSSV